MGVQDPAGRAAHRPGLQNRAPLFQNGDQGVQLILGYRERRAFYRRDALPRQREAEVQRRGDHNTGRAIQLLQQFFIDQDTAIFCGHQIRPPTSRHADFVAAAPHFCRYLADGVVLATFPSFELCYPYILHALGFEDADILVSDDMTLREQLLSSRSKYSATENSSVRAFDFDRLGYHGALTNELD